MRYLTFIFLLIVQITWAQGIIFEKNLDDVFKKAKAQNKLVFIEYYNSDCAACKKITPLLLEKSLGDYYNQRFVSYQINTQNTISDQERLLLNQNNLYFESVPFFIFFDTDQHYIHHSGVQPDINYLLEIARTATIPNKRKGSLEKKYQDNDRSIRTLYAYADLLVVQKNWKKQKEVAEELFKSYPKEELNSQKSYIILKNVIYSTENGFFLYWIENMDQLKGMETGAKSGKEKEVLERIILKELASPFRNEWSEFKKTQMKAWIIKLGITNNPDVYFE